LVAAVAASAFTAGCGALPGSVATNDELLGSWQAEPMAVDGATVAAAERACRGRDVDGDDMAMAEQLVVVDARGGRRLTLVFKGPGASMSECQLELQPGGQMAVGTISASLGFGPVAPLAPNEVSVNGTGGWRGDREALTSVTGRLGSAVTGIRVRLSRGLSVRASVGGGWFTAWWPTDETPLGVEAFDATGQKIGEAPVQ
jgi:hypothetical protein